MAKMRINDQEIVDADVFQIIVEHFPDIIHSVGKDGNILFTNKMATSLLGYSYDELVSMNVREIYAEEILDNMEKGFKRLKEKGEINAVESILKSRDGENIPVEIRSYSIYDDENNFVRTFSIIRDIREIKELQESLIHAGRLAAIGEMAAGIVHDIRSPLNALYFVRENVLNNLGRLEGENPDVRQRLDKSLITMQKAMEAIRHLSDQLVNFSRGVAEKFAPVDLQRIITDSLFIAQSIMKRENIELINETVAGPYYTFGAENQLKQVFVNLIANACDAMAGKKDRRLSISIQQDRKDETDFWRCDISDTGSGIPESISKKIFQSFFTTKEKGKGTGLGLSISRGIIENHQGEIEIQPEKGIGTTFSVYLKPYDPNQDKHQD